VQGISVGFFDNVYRGRDRMEKPEPLPSFPRMVSALVSGAAAEGLLDDLDVFAALEFICANPPSCLVLPNSTSITRNGKSLKTFGKTGRITDRTKFQSVEGVDWHFGYRLDGAVAWGWNDGLEDHVEALRLVAKTVPYLGTSESVCVVTIGEIGEPTHVLSDDEYAQPYQVASSGRVAELVSAHAAKAPDGKKKPSKSTNTVKAAKEVRDASTTPTRCIRDEGYAPVAEEPHGDSPWVFGVELPLLYEIPLDKRTEAAAHIHRALVRTADHRQGYVPEILSGKFENGRPPSLVNNVAVFVVPSGTETGHRGGRDVILVAIPNGAPSYEADAVMDAAYAYTNHKSNGENFRPVIDVDGIRFRSDLSKWWDAPRAGMTRLWRTEPLAVSETKAHGAVTLAHHSAKFMLGNSVDADVVVTASKAVPDNIAPFIHRTHVVERPDGIGGTVRMSRKHTAFRAVYDLNGHIPSTAICGVGQSRHFGIGLLVPFDVPSKESVQ
jgi:CRISPR-associated protein Csb2